MSVSDFKLVAAAVAALMLTVGAAVAADPPAGPSCLLFKETQHQGQQLSVPRNQSRPALEDGWDDEISSLKVAPGCLLVGFKEKGFRGANQTFGPGEYASMPDGWDNHISSVQCNCR